MMIDFENRPLSKLKVSEQQEYFWKDAGVFFFWCRFNLEHCVEKLGARSRAAFYSGETPKKLLVEIRAGLSTELKKNAMHLPKNHWGILLSQTLSKEQDREIFRKHLRGELGQVPKRIMALVRSGHERMTAERHDAFFRNVNDAQMIDYLRALRSQKEAGNRLIVKARGEKLDANGSVSFGGTKISERSYVLRSAATSKRIDRRGIPELLEGLARANDIRFFKQLGKALEKSKPIPEVDWSECDEIEQMVAGAWCGWPHDPHCHKLPPLCLFTTQALAVFCHAALGGKEEESSEDAIAKLISRELRLHKASSPIISSLHPGFIMKGILLFQPRAG